MSRSTNIPVPNSRNNGHVEAEDLLEKALDRKLLPKGAFFVDVDEKRPSGRFKIEVCFPKGSDEDNSSLDLLQSALKKIGFTDVEVNPGRQDIPHPYFNGNIDTFIANFNPSTMVDEMGQIVKQTLRTTDLDIDYDSHEED